MRQRAMIAMALAGGPDLLIADEPTSALDITVQAQILELLKGLQSRLRMGLLLISHDVGVVARVCHRVVVFYAGRVMETGSTKDIFDNPRHPYTRGLLGSRLSIRDRRRVLRPIPGKVPEADAWPAGCRFHPRCREAWDLCGRQEPGLVEIAPGPGGETPLPGSPQAVQRGHEAGSRTVARSARCWLFSGDRRGAP
jgi:peptide/nickel transport system ATP-binding protein